MALNPGAFNANGNDVNEGSDKTTTGFSLGRDSIFFSAGVGVANAQLDPIYNALKKIADDNKATTQIELYKINDKLEFPALVAGIRSGETLYYSTVFITGSNPRAKQTVESYLQRVNEFAAQQFSVYAQHKGNIDILLEDNIINGAVVSIIESVIMSKTECKTLVPASFYTCSRTDELDEATAGMEIAVNLLNSIVMTSTVEASPDLDKSISIGKDINWNISIELNNEDRNKTGVDRLGHSYAKPIVVFSRGTKHNGSEALGVMNTNDVLIESSMSGVMDFRLDAVPEQVLPNGVKLEARTQAIQEFIVTKHNSTDPSISSFLLNLANIAQIFTDKNYSYGVHVETKGKSNSFAKLNVFANTEKDKSGFGKIPKDSDWSLADCMAFLDQNVNTQAGTIVSMKLDTTNTESYINQILFSMATAADAKARNSFKQLFINAANVLVGNGKDRYVDYNGEILLPQVVKYPIGTFANKSGVHSLDTLTLTDFIDGITGAELLDVVRGLTQMNINPMSACQINNKNYDSFVANLKAFSAIGFGHARITGMGYKVSFHPEFIAWLVDLINNTGYTPTVNAPAVNAVAVDRSFATGAFSLGSVGRLNAPVFGNSYSYTSGGSVIGRGYRNF